MEHYWAINKNEIYTCNKMCDLEPACVLTCFNHVQLFVTLWTRACEAPLSMVFSRQGYWSGLPFSSPGDLPDPGIKPGSSILQADALASEPPGKPWVVICLRIPTSACLRARSFKKVFFKFFWSCLIVRNTSYNSNQYIHAYRNIHIHVCA